MALDKHLDKAADAIKRRNYKLAIQVCTQLLGVQPDHGEARAMLRSALFKKAEAKPPSKLGAVLGGGGHMLGAALGGLTGKPDAVARACERYLLNDPLNEAVNLKLGDALEKAGYKKSALAVFKAFADERPRCLEACRRAGALLYETGELSEALEMYERALKVDPRDQEALKARKNLAAEGALRSTGIEKAKSSRDLIKDVDAQRKIEKSHRLQLSKEELEAALTEVEEELGNDPDNVELLVKAADLRIQDRDTEGALDLLERAVSLAPQRSDLASRTGELRIRMQEKRVNRARNKGDEAAATQAEKVLLDMRISEYRRRVEQHPTDFALRYDLGTALLEAGQHDEAIAELQQAVKDPRKKADSLWSLGRAFRRKGLLDLALGQLEKALDASGQSGHHATEIIYEMGAVSEELGRPQDALAHYTRILEQDIGYRDVAQKVDQLKS